MSVHEMIAILLTFGKHEDPNDRLPF